MATAFANLGSVVTVLARDGVLPRAEPFAGERVMDSWQGAGVSVRPGAVAVSPTVSEIWLRLLEAYGR